MQNYQILVIVLLGFMTISHSTDQQHQHHEHDHEHHHHHENDHSHDHNHEHTHVTNQQESEQHDHHEHHSHNDNHNQHVHDDHHHDHDHHHEHNQNHILHQQKQEHHDHHDHSHNNIKEKFVSPLLLLQNFTTDKQKLTFTSVLIVSLPSIPTFFILVLVQKLLGNKKSGELINDSLIMKLIAFSFGTLIGDVFLHILPHLLEGHIHENHSDHQHAQTHDEGHSHSHGIEELKFYFYILGGILFFIIIDYFSIRLYADENDKNKSHSHSHSHAKEEKHEDQNSTDKSQVLVFLFGDFLHNFTDGIALGASYSYNIKIGLSTTLAILMHETPHEIGDFAYLIKKKYSLSRILGTQIFTSIGCMIGAFVGLYYGQIYKEELLSLTAGGFLYMCLSNIFPDIRESFRGSKGTLMHFVLTMFFILCGIGIMFGVTFIE